MSEPVKPPSRLSLLLSYLLLGVTLAYVSPYLLSEEAGKRAVAVLSAPLVAELLYPDWQPAGAAVPAALGRAQIGADEGSPRPPITLTLVTDDDLAAYGATYPLPYSFHAERLDSIAARQPAAIFIDVVFLDERPDASITELVQTLCSIGLGSATQRPIPLFLASLRYADQPLRTELADAARRGCFKEVAVPRLADQLDRNNWEYVLQLADAAAGATGTDAPALALYKALDPEATWAAGVHTSHLALVWGMSPHPYNIARMKDADGVPLCRAEYRFTRDLPVLGNVVDDLWGDDSRQFGKPFCPYHASMPMYFLSAKPELADQLLLGRVVVYGVDLQSVGDNAYTPLHGAIPGAHVHAMALDNLLRYGPDYPRAQGFSFTQAHAGTLFALAMILLVAVFNALVPDKTAWGSRWPDRLPRLARWLEWSRTELESDADAPRSRRGRLARLLHQQLLGAWPLRAIQLVLNLAVSLVLLLAVGWVGLHVFNLGVLSWLEYAVLPLLLSTFEGGHRLAGWFDGVGRYVCMSPQEWRNKT